jgi:2-polyprenyl-3-methyl-5-hydroxy-6-metoxy-1,4-benzoquinol methylase
MQILNTCPLCNSEHLKPYSMKYEKGFPHISRTQCTNCALVFANPMATTDELMRFYTNYYNKDNFQALSYKEKIQAHIDQITQSTPALLQKKYPWVSIEGKGKKYLDIGAGLGVFLSIHHQLGYEVYGTEYDADALSFIQQNLPKANLFQGDLLTAPYTAEQFDVIQIHHVIEHIVDPHSYMQCIKHILKPGGILIIGTPDIGAPAYQLFRRWNFLSQKVPLIVDGLEHTIVFNKSNLRKLTEKHGFEVLQQYGEALGDRFSNIFSSDLSFRKKIARFAQTLVKVNQMLIAKKR